jgi:putative transposase
MEDQPITSASHAVFYLRLPIVFATKYRRKTLHQDLQTSLRQAFAKVLEDWRCSLIEFGAEEDHGHLLVKIPPALNISTLINNLKTASARRARHRYATHLAHFYWKPYFWHRAYYVGSVGGAPLEVVKRDVANQSVVERPQSR